MLSEGDDSPLPVVSPSKRAERGEQDEEDQDKKQPEMFFTGDPDPMDDADDCGGPTTGQNDQSRSSSGEPEPRNLLGEAVPMDKLHHGVNVARNFWSWGFSKVVENANNLREEIANSEAIAETRRLVTETSQNLVETANEAAKVAEEKLVEATANLQQLHEEKLQPAVQAAAASAREGVASARAEVATFAEEAKPMVSEVQEKTRFGIMSAMATAAQSAIWFQSLGSTMSDSEGEEDEERKSPVAQRDEHLQAPQAPPPMEPQYQFQPPPRRQAQTEEQEIEPVEAEMPQSCAASLSIHESLDRAVEAEVEDGLREMPEEHHEQPTEALQEAECAPTFTGADVDDSAPASDVHKESALGATDSLDVAHEPAEAAASPDVHDGPPVEEASPHPEEATPLAELQEVVAESMPVTVGPTDALHDAQATAEVDKEMEDLLASLDEPIKGDLLVDVEQTEALGVPEPSSEAALP